MVFWDSLPQYEPCRLCGKKDIVFDYDQQDYRLFRYDARTVALGGDLYAHAACLARRFGIGSLVKIAGHQLLDFFWMLKESDFGRGSRSEFETHGRVRTLLLKSLVQLERSRRAAV